jgi:predicted MFS family arabinose efflux permease
VQTLGGGQKHIDRLLPSLRAECEVARITHEFKAGLMKAQRNMSETSAVPPMRRESASLAMAAIAAQVIGGLFAQMSPFVIGGLIAGLSLSERDTGLIASVELVSIAVIAIMIAPVLHRLPYRRAGPIAVALTLLAQGASIFSASWTLLLLLRGLAGVGEGALYAVSLCIVASHFSNPDKGYGYFQLAWALGSVPLFAAGGELTAAFAHRGIFALIVGVTLALAPLLLLAPETRPRSGHAAPADTRQVAPLLGVMTFAAVALYLTASAAIYAFSAPLGERAGLITSAVGYALTVASLVGLGGAGAATALNIRWGRAAPISAFCAGFSLVTLALCLWRDPTAYVVSLVASVVVYYFSIPYLFGLAAALDRRGRWAAVAGSAYLLGFAAGPLVGGTVIAGAGYERLAAVCVTLSVAVWALALIVDQRISGATPASIGRGLA